MCVRAVHASLHLHHPPAPRRLRLVSLATQRFLASILDEAINIHKRRRLAPAAQLRADGHDPRDKRVVLSTEELAEALKEVRRVSAPSERWSFGFGGAHRAS